MKNFMMQHKNNLLLPALYAGLITSLFIYVVFRSLFYEFPMTWNEEISFFVKIVLSCCFAVATSTGGFTLLHAVLLKSRVKNLTQS